MRLFGLLLLPLVLANSLSFPARFEAKQGFFIQGSLHERKPLEVGFQFDEFGAIKPWDEVHAFLRDNRASAKLIFLIRHGEALHNVVLQSYGRQIWTEVIPGLCWFQHNHMLDPPLTESGHAQCSQLNQLLVANLHKLTDSYAPPLVLTSPLHRTSQTAIEAFSGIEVLHGKLIASEHLRESVKTGYYNDARKSVSGAYGQVGNCTFEEGYANLFGHAIHYSFMSQGQGFGMFSDADELFSETHGESPNLMQIRLAGFLHSLFDQFPSNQVVFAVTHSKTITTLMDMLHLGYYRPANAEIVPILVMDKTA